MPWYELQANGSLLPLNGPYEVLADGVSLGPELSVRDMGQLPVPDAPTILATTNMPSRTSAQIDWSAPTDGPAVTGYEIYRDNVFVASVVEQVLTYTNSGLPTATPELIFLFGIRSIGVYGPGPFTTISLQWQGTPAQPPSPPTGLTRSNLLPTSVTLSWSEAAPTGAAIAGHRVRYGAGTLLKNNIAPDARTTAVTGLTEQTTYSGVYVTRYDDDGLESGPSNTLTFTTPATSGGVVQDPINGMNLREDAGEPRQFHDYEAYRIYNIGQSDSLAAIAANARVLALTDTSIDWNDNPTTVATLIRNYLIWLYEGTGSASRQDVEAHIAIGNEVDRDIQSGADVPQNFKDIYAQARAVIHEVSGSTRRFPNAMVAVNMTQNNIRTGGSGPRFKSIARYLDIFTCSMYPPGRQSDPTVFNPYSFYCDDVFDALADWRGTGGVGGSSLVGQLDQFATWEFGIPIDHAADDGSPNAGGATNWSIRPRYVGGGSDSANTNWTGFLNYIYNKCVAAGVSMREQCYWNHQDNPDIPNPLVHDAFPARPVPGGIDTEHAWHDWTPGSTLPNL